MVDPVADGSLIFSIDLHLNGNQTSLAESRLLDQGLRQLLASLDCHGIAATFAIQDAATNSLTEPVLASRMAHEIAVLGDASWASPGTGRALFAKELGRQLCDTRSQGVCVSTLALPGTIPHQHLDLLVKREISAVRTVPPVVGRSITLQEPRNLRFGLCEFPAACCLPTRQRRSLRRSRDFSLAKRGIKHAAKRGKTVQLALDGSTLVERDLSDLSTIDAVLRAAAALRDAQRLLVETIRDRSNRLATRRSTSPARSILRPAA